MAGAEIQRRLNWLVAVVVGVVEETPSVRSLTLSCPGWPGHRPGQHIDLRLTAPDGYQAQRSYSIATPSEGELVTITVERIFEGEVSPFLLDVVAPGDRLELRGPVGGYFVWDPGEGPPVFLAGGGSGVVPLMAMLRARISSGDGTPMHLLVSARSRDDIVYREELETLSHHDGVVVTLTLTRSRPEGWTGYDRRVDGAMLRDLVMSPDSGLVSYVCGPTGFTESVAGLLVALGHPPHRVLTERFGPTGG